MISTSKRRLVILTEGKLDIHSAKTAVSIVRYCKDDVVAIIDLYNAGKDLESIIGIGKDIPIFSTVKETLHLKPDSLLIGIAPLGGVLPIEWQVHIRDALQNKLNVISGLHTYISDDLEFSKLAQENQLNIYDVRKPPEKLPIGTGKAKEVKAFRVLTVGTDCNIGKMVTAIEIANAAKKRDIDACFVATGQTGILIEGSGIAIDHVLSDFISGATEKLILDRAQYNLLCIEGQGAVIHPAYSGVNVGLLHGALPQGIIMCHQPTRKTLRHFENFPILPIQHIIELYEKLVQPFQSCKVLGISLNCYGMSDEEALREIEKTEREIKLPATDPIRFGVDKFLEVIQLLLP